MKKIFFIPFAIIFASCGPSKEENQKKALELAKENADEYCKCISKNEDKMICYRDITTKLEIALHELNLENEDEEKAKDAFKLIKEKCDSEVFVPMDPGMQKAYDQYKNSK
jgi:hypothetical protein